MKLNTDLKVTRRYLNIKHAESLLWSICLFVYLTLLWPGFYSDVVRFSFGSSELSPASSHLVLRQLFDADRALGSSALFPPPEFNRICASWNTESWLWLRIFLTDMIIYQVTLGHRSIPPYLLPSPCLPLLLLSLPSFPPSSFPLPSLPLFYAYAIPFSLHHPLCRYATRTVQESGCCITVFVLTGWYVPGAVQEGSGQSAPAGLLPAPPAGADGLPGQPGAPARPDPARVLPLRPGRVPGGYIKHPLGSYFCDY